MCRPFRGRAVCVQDRDTKFDDLEIDFAELDRRKAAELEKLEAVINFARTGSCRQSVILDYFGETDAEPCGSCDRCDDVAEAADSPGGIAPSIVPEGVEPEMLLRGIQVILSGVTRMHGRFGRNLIAQMLCGSKNKKLQGLRLNRLSTYGLLGTLKQGEIVDILDVLSSAGLVESVEVEQRRPTIQISEAGRRVMHRSEPVPASCRLSFPLAKKLALAASRIEAADVQTSSAGTDDLDTETDEPAAPSTASEQLTEELAERLKRWRRKTSAALDIPAYRVLTNAVIERLSEQMPQSTEALGLVNGIGSATVEQFGYDVVELIQQAISESESAPSDDAPPEFPDPDSDNLTPQAEPRMETREPRSRPEFTECEGPGLSSTTVGVPEPPRSSPGNSPRSEAYWTWRLFDDGYSAEEICQIRDRDRIALAEDLRLAVAEGLSVRQSWLSEPEVGG